MSVNAVALTPTMFTPMAMATARPGANPALTLAPAERYSAPQTLRALTVTELAQVAKGKSQWLPKLFPSYTTPLWQVMASPAKIAFIKSVFYGLIGSSAGIFAKSGIVALLCGAVLAVLGGVLGYHGRLQRNENLEFMMRRMPEGAVKYNLLENPIVQADLTRQAMRTGSSDFLNGMIASSFLTPGSYPNYPARGISAPRSYSRR